MIAEPLHVMEQPGWQAALRNAVTRVGDLLELLGLSAAQVPVSARSDADFRLRVPRGFVARMRRGDPHDPLLRQVLPATAEQFRTPGDALDPVGDLAAASGPALLRKYAGRALLVATGACAIHCRYCFRRHFPYAAHSLTNDNRASILAALAAATDVTEIILSGGDPLLLSDVRLAALVADLERVPHLRRLRIHTRVPVVLPERVDAALLAWLGRTRLRPVVVLHANHAQEIDASVDAALARLRDLGVPLLNQAVLLRGVNDSVDALVQLSETLFESGVLPYYLHALDPVRGAAHFAVGDDIARALATAVRARLPGYLVPTLVREIAGHDFKLPL
ncbi:MAG: EF-P beta-lysylation protein EpmB [Gammaproteobacteria bacterium]|nr:EF-P beta-lysylation protein EpmB [Gammaproteobacteria bacterium]